MKKNLVLDIDNTLISTVSKTLVDSIKESGQNIPLHYIINDEIKEMVIYPRPYLQDFLDFVFQHYNVSIFTAAETNYALYVIQNLILQAKSNRKLDFIMTYPHYKNCIYLYEKHKLINNIAEGENLDVNFLKTKYLKSKELNSVSGVKNNTADENEDLLDKTIINNETYYFENKEKGKVFNSDYNHVGYYKNSNIVFI